MSGGDWKAMFKGIQDNDLNLVEFYLKSGIDPNYQHPEYLALPLAESVRYAHIDITKLLLDHGADPNIIEMESKMTVAQLVKSKKDKAFIDLVKHYVGE